MKLIAYTDKNSINNDSDLDLLVSLAERVVACNDSIRLGSKTKIGEKILIKSDRLIALAEITEVLEENSTLWNKFQSKSGKVWKYACAIKPLSATVAIDEVKQSIGMEIPYHGNSKSMNAWNTRASAPEYSDVCAYRELIAEILTKPFA